MREPGELAAALREVALIAVQGPWSRAVGYRHLLGPPPGMSGAPQPLWGGAARIAGARFTPPGGFDSIYLAADPITAFIEVSALVLLPGGPVPVRSAPWVIVSVEGLVSRVLDLTDAETLRALGTSEQEMTGTWATLAAPPTQLSRNSPMTRAGSRGCATARRNIPAGSTSSSFPTGSG